MLVFRCLEMQICIWWNCEACGGTSLPRSLSQVPQWIWAVCRRNWAEFITDSVNETVAPPPYTPRTACFPPVKIVILALLFHKFCFQQCLITDKRNAVSICTSWALFIQDQLGIVVGRTTFHFFVHSFFIFFHSDLSSPQHCKPLEQDNPLIWNQFLSCCMDRY